MSFESELSKGNFTIPECVVCKKTVWPPVEFCDNCYGNITLKKGEFEGKIIEFSEKNEDYFCIVEFDSAVRVIAKMSKIPKIDQIVQISKCGISDGNYFFHVN